MLALSMVGGAVVFSGFRPAPSAQRGRPAVSRVRGRYFGQAPPGMAPQRFAPGFISTEGYDITPTFSPALDEVFFGHRPTEAGNNNKIYHSRMVNGRWQQPALASFSSGGMEFEAQFSVDGNTLYFNRGSALYFSQRTPRLGVRPGPSSPRQTGDVCGRRRERHPVFHFRSPPRHRALPAHERYLPGSGGRGLPWRASVGGAGRVVLGLRPLLHSRRERRPAGCLSASAGRTGVGRTRSNSGTGINATGTELIPKVSPDGKYLFFQRKVDGNTDIYWVDARVLEE